MPLVYRLAIPSPLRRYFHYLPSDTNREPEQGCRMTVEFGSRDVTAYFIDCEHIESSKHELKSIKAQLDDSSAIPSELFSLIQWASNYYQFPLGMSLNSVLPKKLRQGDILERTKIIYQLSTKGNGLSEDALKSAKKQQAFIKVLREQKILTQEQLKTFELNKNTAKALLEKELIESKEISRDQSTDNKEFNSRNSINNILKATPLTLNAHQAHAVNSINTSTQFECHLIDGVTGSGKTEVYLQIIEKVLQQNQQVLVLVPEIGLTPQTFARFETRFNCTVKALHSGLNDTQRFKHWAQALFAEANIIIGTRSAVFTPFKNLGIIIVDEEHDLSYKQQDGFLYNARDVAIRRAQQLNIPIVLGSATPSLESLNNAQLKRFNYLALPERANNAQAPEVELVDLRKQILQTGFSTQLIAEINNTLKQQQQAIIFLNRRGFAPTLLCHDCGWIAQCNNCDTRMTVHKKANVLRCHHCQAQRPLVNNCPSCQSLKLHALGSGTERSESFLREYFPNTKLVRIDRDNTQKKHALQDALDSVKDQPAILIGTQMLAKGHHLPDVTLVAILNSDALLFANDFRSKERMAQLLTQVSGRAGRAQHAGRVLVQTHLPEHPFWQNWLTGGYARIAEQALEERKNTLLPPHAHLMFLRMEHPHLQQCFSTLQMARDWLQKNHPQLDIIGPFPANLMKRANRFRFLLQIKSLQRGMLHKASEQLIAYLETNKAARKTRWTVDIDPQDCS